MAIVYNFDWMKSDCEWTISSLDDCDWTISILDDCDLMRADL